MSNSNILSLQVHWHRMGGQDAGTETVVDRETLPTGHYVVSPNDTRHFVMGPFDNIKSAADYLGDMDIYPGDFILAVKHPDDGPANEVMPFEPIHMYLEGPTPRKIIVTGNVADGFDFYGPADHDEPNTENFVQNLDDWTFVPVQPIFGYHAGEHVKIESCNKLCRN